MIFRESFLPELTFIPIDVFIRLESAENAIEWGNYLKLPFIKNMCQKGDKGLCKVLKLMSLR